MPKIKEKGGRDTCRRRPRRQAKHVRGPCREKGLLKKERNGACTVLPPKQTKLRPASPAHTHSFWNAGLVCPPFVVSSSLLLFLGTSGWATWPPSPMVVVERHRKPPAPLRRAKPCAAAIQTPVLPLLLAFFPSSSTPLLLSALPLLLGLLLVQDSLHNLLLLD